jgi:hypothetical protein
VFGTWARVRGGKKGATQLRRKLGRELAAAAAPPATAAPLAHRSDDSSSSESDSSDSSDSDSDSSDGDASDDHNDEGYGSDAGAARDPRVLRLTLSSQCARSEHARGVAVREISRFDPRLSAPDYTCPAS